MNLKYSSFSPSHVRLNWSYCLQFEFPLFFCFIGKACIVLITLNATLLMNNVA